MNRPDEAKITSTFSTVGDTRRETAVGAATGSLTAFMDNGDLERDESAVTGGAAALPLHRGTHTHLRAETCKENLRSRSQNMPAANDRLQLRLAKIEHDNSDLSRLLATTGIATLLLDADCGIRRYTLAVRRLFTLTDAALG